MHNIHNLEQRWLRYKIKSYMPSIIISIFSIVLMVTLYLIFDSKKNAETQLASENIKKEELLKEENTTKDTIVKTKEEKIKKIKEKQETISKNTEEIQDSTKEKIILTPSLDFMKKLRTNSMHSYDMQNTEDTYEKLDTSTIEETQEEIIVEEHIDNYSENKQKPQINISKKEDRKDLQDVIIRFKKNNNPALSLFVAKKYYKLGDYKKAYNYSLITNEINNDIEQSWLIFAKSLVKLNKRKKAIETLTRYVNHSGSGNAKVLLDNIKSGKFK